VSSNRLHATATTAIGLIAISSLGSVHPANGRDITLALRAASRPVRANRRSAEGHAEAIVSGPPRPKRGGGCSGPTLAAWTRLTLRRMCLEATLGEDVLDAGDRQHRPRLRPSHKEEHE